MKNKISNINCIDGMKLIKSSSIDLTVTSPPYDDLRTYNDSSEWNFEVFCNVSKELYRITVNGGVVVWIVGDAVINKSETGTSFKQALEFMKSGFLLHDTMIYAKNSSSFPASKDSNRYSQIFEYMFIFSKNGPPKTANLICDKRNKWAGHQPWGKIGARNKNGEMVENKESFTVPDFSPRNNIWTYNTGAGFQTKDEYAYDHPAMFPELLAEDHILTWSHRNDLVFDPFMGAGTTCKMAIKNDRHYLGFEVDETYYNIANKRIVEELERQKRDPFKRGLIE